MADLPSSKAPPGILTFVGRLLALVSLVIVCAGFYLCVMFVHEKSESGALPSGHYPVAFLLIPGVLVALLFFIVAAFMLEAIGLRVWNRDKDANHSK